ncbi:MAG: LexA family protein [Arenicella sp.]
MSKNDKTIGKQTENNSDSLQKNLTHISQASPKRGGKRSGSGRPSGTGKYGEPTKAIRVPEGSVTQIKTFLKNHYIPGGQQGSNIESINKKSKDTPHSISSDVDIIAPAADWTEGNNIETLNIPLYSSRVAAGFPSPADDHVDNALDLNEYLIERPDSTFMLRVEGESMKDAGIVPDDILIVDRSKKAIHNKIVIAALDGELTVKRLYRRGGLIKLLPENPDYPDIEIKRESDLVIWGVVIGSFRRFQSNTFL